MRTIAHISDLHFGTEIAVVADALARELHARAPSLVVVSGDLTQRARRRQFAAAREFLARLPQPQLVVPGNHDVPLYDVARRFFAPLLRYRRFIGEELDPAFADDEIFVSGLNTARSFTWKSGRISVAQLDTLTRRLAEAGNRRKIVVTHHPFIPPPHDAGIQLVGRATLAIPLLNAAGVDLLLAGHLHRGYAGDIRPHYPAERRALIAVQAGTATSGRTRDEPNAYNWITIDRDRIGIAVRVWNGHAFEPVRENIYQRSDEGWTPIADGAPQR